VWESESLQDAGAYDAVVFADDGEPAGGELPGDLANRRGDRATVWHSRGSARSAAPAAGRASATASMCWTRSPAVMRLRKFGVDSGLASTRRDMPGFLCQTMPFVARWNRAGEPRGEQPSNDFLYAWKDTGSSFSLQWQVPGFSGPMRSSRWGSDGFGLRDHRRLPAGPSRRQPPAPCGLDRRPAGFSMAACDRRPGRLYYSNGAVGAGHSTSTRPNLTLLWDTASAESTSAALRSDRRGRSSSATAGPMCAPIG